MNSDISNKKPSIIKYILLFIDIIVIAGVIFLYFTKYKNKHQTFDDYKYQFKEFRYNFPKDIKFNIDSDDNMVLSTDEWSISVDILGDSGNYILGSLEQVKEDYSKRFENVSVEYTTISSSTLLIIKLTNEDENVINAYFKTFKEPFIYEAVLRNNDNSFDTTAYEKIFSSLMNGIYVEDSTVKYNYVKNPYIEEKQNS